MTSCVHGAAGVLPSSTGLDVNLIATQLRNAGSGTTQAKADGSVYLDTLQASTPEGNAKLIEYVGGVRKGSTESRTAKEDAP